MTSTIPMCKASISWGPHTTDSAWLSPSQPSYCGWRNPAPVCRWWIPLSSHNLQCFIVANSYELVQTSSIHSMFWFFSCAHLTFLGCFLAIARPGKWHFDHQTAPPHVPLLLAGGWFRTPSKPASMSTQTWPSPKHPFTPKSNDLYTGWWFNPLEKYEFVNVKDYPIQCIMENKKCLKPPTSMYIYIYISLNTWDMLVHPRGFVWTYGKPFHWWIIIFTMNIPSGKHTKKLTMDNHHAING